MNKSETREVARIVAAGPVLGLDYMARALSALIRATRTGKARRDLIEVAARYGAHKSPEFIIEMDSSTAIRHNPEQEHRAYRWEVSCDAGVFGFPTRALADAYQATLTQSLN